MLSCKVPYEFTAASEAYMYTQADDNEACTLYSQLQVNVHFTRIVPLLVYLHTFRNTVANKMYGR